MQKQTGRGGLVVKSSSNQSGLTTQIRTHPRATQKGRIKCRHHVTIPAVPLQEAILEEGRKKYMYTYNMLCILNLKDPASFLIQYIFNLYQGLNPDIQILKLMTSQSSWTVGPKPVGRNDISTLRPKYYIKAENR